MTGTKKGVVLTLLYTVVIGALLYPVAGLAYTEPLLLVYPDKPAEFHYDANRYEALGPSDGNYDPDYDIGGVMLWDKVENRIPYEVYRAPQITSFVPSTNGMNQFVLMNNKFWLIIDGFSLYPRQINEISVRFIPDPPHASAVIMMNNEPLEYLITRISGINVQTETPEGFYSNTTQVLIWWSSAVGMRITAYGDKNRNLIYDGGPPMWSIYVIDNTVPVRETTWGAIKSLYSD
jgi:hypothetical protein